MKRYGTTFSGVSLLLMCIVAAAQSTTLPTELKGKWAWPERSVSQVFTLTSIKPVSDQAATATLTWWTMDTKCALRNVPIELRITDQTIAFDATTK